jgi:hypothetical protein
MKRSQLKQLIKEEIHKVLTEIQPSILKRINAYIDNTHHMESNDFLDNFNIPSGADFNPIYQLRDMVDNFLDSPEGSEAEELFQDTIVWHLKTAGEGFTDQQIKEYIQLLKLRRNREQIGGVKLNETHIVKKSQLKQIIKEEVQKILKENEYLDQLLDKISSSGMDSLSPKEKTYLDQYSKGANPKSLSPETFKVRLEKNEFGVYDSYLYTQDNSWIPQQVFDIGNSIYMGEPDDPNRIPVYLNTYPKPDPESNMTDFKDAKTNDPNGAIIFSDKEGKMLDILKDVGNLDNITSTNFGTSKIKIPGKYVELLKF